MPDDIVLYARVLTELAEHEYAALLTCLDEPAPVREPQRAVPHRPLVFDHA